MIRASGVAQIKHNQLQLVQRQPVRHAIICCGCMGPNQLSGRCMVHVESYKRHVLMTEVDTDLGVFKN